MNERCPQCGEPMGCDPHDPRRRSVDHIMPRGRGGLDIMFGDTRNTRIMCQSCNGLLARCGQCIAALACVRDVASATRRPQAAVLRAWKMLDALTAHGAAEVARRKAAASRAVMISRAIARVRHGEFAYPADTPAARVWNLATLASRTGSTLGLRA